MTNSQKTTIKMERLEFHISYDCPNDCIFCSEKDQLDKFRGQFVEKKSILDNLQVFSARGFNHVTFTGGETTLHPDIVDLVRSAKQLGYKTYISSNGGLFASSAFSKKIFPFLDEVCFSVHGHNAKFHNFLTKNKQSFSRLKKALENMEKYGSDIFCFVNIVITKYNFPFIDEIINFISQYKKIKQVLVSYVAPEGSGFKNFINLTVPLKEIKKKVPFLVEFSQKKSLNIRFFGLPLCVLDGYEIYSNDVYWSSRTTLERWAKGGEVILKKTLSHDPSRKKIYTEKCNDCVKRGLCGGIFEKYVDEYGNKEIGIAS